MQARKKLERHYYTSKTESLSALNTPGPTIFQLQHALGQR